MVILITQILFTFTTLWAKYNLSGAESFGNSLKGGWLGIYISVYVVATFMQLYVFKVTNIFKAMAFFSGFSLILTVVLGCILFNEILDWRDVISIILVLTALTLISREKGQKAQNKS